MKVLIIEDDNSYLKINKELAEPYCDEIVTATNGVDGLCQFKKQRFDLVITDYRMPFMDGVQLAARIREGNINWCVPIMLVSDACYSVKDASLFTYMVSKGEFEAYKSILAELRSGIRDLKILNKVKDSMLPETEWLKKVKGDNRLDVGVGRLSLGRPKK